MTRGLLPAGLLALLTLLAPLPAVAQDHPSYSGSELPDTGGIDPKSDARVRAVTEGLACNCGTCPHEPVSTCTCGTAARLRAEVAALIAAGKSGEDARAGMIEKYGYAIVAKPPFSGLNLLAWVGPFVAIAAVAVLLFLRLGQWKKRAEANAAPSTPDAAGPVGGVGDPYLARIEAELKEGR